MQKSAVEEVLTSLRSYFPFVQFVEKAEDGFQDASRYAYVRSEAEDGYEYNVEEDWIIGRYVAVAEDNEENILPKLWSLVEKAGGTVVSAGEDPEVIYREETNQELRRHIFAARVLFTIRTEVPCMSC